MKIKHTRLQNVKRRTTFSILYLMIASICIGLYFFMKRPIFPLLIVACIVFGLYIISYLKTYMAFQELYTPFVKQKEKRANMNVIELYQHKKFMQEVSYLYHNLFPRPFTKFQHQKEKEDIDEYIYEKKKGGHLYLDEKLYIIVNSIEQYQSPKDEPKNNPHYHKIQEKIQQQYDKHKVISILLFALIIIQFITYHFNPNILFIIGIMTCTILGMFFLPMKNKYAHRQSSSIYGHIHMEMHIIKLAYQHLTHDITFLQTKIREFFTLLHNEKTITPSISLLFADMVELYSEKIHKKQLSLMWQKRLWKRVVRPIFFIPKPLPPDIETFLSKEDVQFFAEIQFLQKSIQYFADNEIKKLSMIYSQNSEKFGNLQLSNKRQELLLKSLENIKRI